MKIEVFLDDADKPFEIIEAPNRFDFDSSSISDGQNVLRFRAVDDDDIVSERLIQFLVQNGPEIAVHGIRSGETVAGRFSVLANAYSAKLGDEFEPQRIETPAPIPIWAWVLFLVIVSWGAGYLSQELHQHVVPDYFSAAKIPTKATVEPKIAPDSEVKSDDNSKDSSDTLDKESDSDSHSLTNNDWQALGEQIYGSNCGSCHQANGQGLSGVFPSLVGNAVVVNDDASEHISTIILGLSGKTIDGVDYAAAMPAFQSLLNDEEIAAVVNHERSFWGNSAKLVDATDVAAIRALPAK